MPAIRAGQIARMMAEVGVHVEEAIVVVLDGVTHAGQDRRAQAQLAGPMQHVHLRIGRGGLVGPGSRAVG